MVTPADSSTEDALTLEPAHVARLPAALQALALSTASRRRMQPADEGPPFAKALKEPVDPNVLTLDAFDQMTRGCIAHWAGNYASLTVAASPQSFHQMRVAIRRLRSLMGVYRPVIARGAAVQPERALKAFFAKLGDVRNIDVFLGETAPMLFPDDASIRMVRRALAAERASLAAAVQKEAAADAHAALPAAFADWLESGVWREVEDPVLRLWRSRKLREFAPLALEKAHRRARKGAKRAKTGGIDDWHALRILLKKLRYNCEFFSGLYPIELTQPYIEAMKALQDELGALNDLEVAKALLGGQAARRSGRMAAAFGQAHAYCDGYLAATAETGLEKAAARWDAFSDRKPFWLEA